MESVEPKQVQVLLKAMTKEMVGGDQGVTDEDLVGALLEDADEGVIREVAVTVRVLLEEVVDSDFEDEALGEYLTAVEWAKEKDMSRVVQKWWRGSKDLIHFARLSQGSIKPALESFSWNIITTTTSAGASENLCRIYLKIRKPDGAVMETSFDVDEETLAHVVEIVTQIEETVAGAV